MAESKNDNVQKMRYSNEELITLNATFSEKQGYASLVLLRKFLLQGELTETEKASLSVFTTGTLLSILKKTFLPTLDFTTPIGQLVDLWTNIDTKNKGVDDAWLEMGAREIMIDYVQGRFDELEGLNGSTRPQFADLNYNKARTPLQNFLNLSARNTTIAHVDFQIGQLWILSGVKKETWTEIEKRLFKDSAK